MPQKIYFSFLSKNLFVVDVENVLLKHNAITIKVTTGMASFTGELRLSTARVTVLTDISVLGSCTGLRAILTRSADSGSSVITGRAWQWASAGESSGAEAVWWAR